MKDPNQTGGSIEDIFNEALELDSEALEDLATEVAWTPFTDEIESDPTFYDEQVINVPVIENPGLKSMSEYPDTQIYDHLFSLDDEEDDLLFPEDVPVPVIEEMPAPSVPEDAPVATIPEARPAASDQRKPGRKPAVRKAGEKKPEPEAVAVEEAVVKPAIVEEAKPIRKKPRVKRAGEKPAPAVTAPAKEAPVKDAPAKTAPPQAAPIAKKAPAKPAAGGTHAPARPAPPKKAPSKPASAKAASERAKVPARETIPEDDFDETVDLITWDEGSSVKVAKKQAAARRAEKLAFFDKFKKKLGRKFS